MFPRIRKGSSLCGFIWKENPEKGVRQWKKGIPDLKAESVCMCIREKKITALKFMQSFQGIIRNVNLPLKKDFKFAELLNETSFFFYFRDRPENGEENKLRRRRKYKRKSN